MIPLTQQAHDFVRKHCHPGDIAIDATLGNGHDSRFLLDCVGDSGTVYAFDIQQNAIESARQSIPESDRRCRMVLASHESMAQHVAAEHYGQIAAVMFNLGYLPGGDHEITTRKGSTVKAVKGAYQLLKSGGILSILAYRGHLGGLEESTAVESILHELAALNGNFSQTIPIADISPILYSLVK